MKKNNKTKIAHVISIIVFIILQTFGIVLYYSGLWLKNAWGGVDFSTAIFQLRTPLAGVNNNVLFQYVIQVLIPALVIAAIFIGCIVIVSEYLRVDSWELKIQVEKFKGTIKGFQYWRTFSIISILFVWIPVTLLANEVGLISYYKNTLFSRTKIYENYYVKPTEKIIHFPEKKRNLLMIYMESMEATYSSVDEGGGKATNFIPNLTEIAKENVSFSNRELLGGMTQGYGASWTMGALLASTSGVPFALPVEGNDMELYSEFLPGLVTLGDVLQQNGYTNYFACGSRAFYGGRKLYFEQHGNYVIQDYFFAKEAGYIPSDYDVFWGMEDQKLYTMVKEEITKVADSGEPFNYTMLTVDTHHPDGYICEQCEYHGGENQYGCAIRCADRQIADFLNWVKEQSWYDNTSVVIVGDHKSMNADFWDDIPEGYQRCGYDCFINPAIDIFKEKQKNRIFTSVDYFPTVLASMNVEISGDRLGLGTNLFSDTPTLMEQLGAGEYNAEVAKYSKYYTDNFEKQSE